MLNCRILKFLVIGSWWYTLLFRSDFIKLGSHASKSHCSHSCWCPIFVSFHSHLSKKVSTRLGFWLMEIIEVILITFLDHTFKFIASNINDPVHIFINFLFCWEYSSFRRCDWSGRINFLVILSLELLLHLFEKPNRSWSWEWKLVVLPLVSLNQLHDFILPTACPLISASIRRCLLHYSSPLSLNITWLIKFNVDYITWIWSLKCIVTFKIVQKRSRSSCQVFCLDYFEVILALSIVIDISACIFGKDAHIFTL